MDRLGGGINAYTARECTRYYAQTLKENAGAVLDLLCDIVLHPRLDEADMELERRVILEEMAMYEDNGEEVAHEALCASLWPDSPLGRAICGTVETVSALTVGDLRRYRDRHYAPGRLLAVVAGGFDREEVLERLHRELGVLLKQRKRLLRLRRLFTGPVSSCASGILNRRRWSWPSPACRGETISGLR